MGTHYETLGVAASANAAEIRKAYLRRARALHPDRQLGRPEGEARQAEVAMQQVNVAWNVLSDPKKKSDYDQSLKGSRAPKRSTSSRPSTTRPPQGQRPNPPPQRPAAQQRSSQSQSQSRTIDETEGDGSVSIWASIPVLIVLGMLLGIVIVSAFFDNSDADNRPVVPTDTPLVPGDCFVLVGGTPRERSCATGTADGKVTQVGPEAGNCPQDALPLKDPNSDFFLCWDRLIPGSMNTVEDS